MTETGRRREGTDRGRDRGQDDALPALRFRLEDLETFLKVAETGSFSQAAAQLGLSQPSVTSRVQRLEAVVRAELLQRTTRRVVVTEAGTRLRVQAEAALRDLRILLRDFSAESEVRKRQMTLAATPLVASAVLLPLIGRYVQAHPRTEIRLHDVAREQALAELASGAADMAIMVFEEGHPEFDFDFLTAEECVVIAPLGHPLLERGEVPFEDILEFPLIVPDFYQSLRRRIEAEYARRGLPFASTVRMSEVRNINTVIGMVAAGMGITFIPRTLIARDQRRTIGAVRIKDFRLERPYGIVTLRDRPMSPVARSFARFVHASIPEGFSGWSEGDGLPGDSHS